MFGRIRASPSSAEWLEFERPSSKLFKHDSLSIYETTLVKLKQGSQRSLSLEHSLSPRSGDSMDFESSENGLEDSSSMVTSLCCEQGMPVSSSEGSSMNTSLSLNQDHNKKGKEMSIQMLFSRYNSSHHENDRGLPKENHSATSSPVSSGDYSVVTQSSVLF